MISAVLINASVSKLPIPQRVPNVSCPSAKDTISHDKKQ